ncbi:MAG: peptidoglycan-associated lipoprotein Pal [Gemmatimonadota bacterium]|nr:peptidoglycan-associated lipoprotein Pal [Gemmatimonadota bacterium]
MNKKLFLIPLSVVLVFVVFGCHKKEAPPPPPPPPPPVVEKKPEPVKVDSTEIWARQRAEKLAKAKSRIEAQTIYFDFDKSDVKPEYRSVLMDIAGVMKEFSDITVSIEGHCDERGTTAYNLALGERRANAAKQFLIDSGVPGSRIDAKSWGEEKPVAMGHNEGAWSKNRRDEFITR